MVNKFQKIFITLVFIFSSISAIAGQVQVSVESRLDKSKVSVGELVKYEIIIKFTEDVQVSVPPPGINLGGFEIRDYFDHDPVKVDNQIEKIVEFVIAAYDTGSFVIPPTAVAYMTSDSVRNILYTDEVGIRVETVLNGEEEDIIDIKSILSIARDWMFWIILGIALLLILIGIYWYYFRKKDELDENGIKIVPDEPAHILAFAAIEELKRSNFLAEDKIKTYHIEMTDILRFYLQRRYFVPVLEKTTSETVELLTKQSVESEIVERIKNLLTESDFVKFAKYIPENERSMEMLNDVYSIVDTTKIVSLEALKPDEINKVEKLVEAEDDTVIALDEPLQVVSDDDVTKISDRN